ncbi:MAG: sigma factor-like helix-turn-helix DNA-binding protein [Eubacteriales bacterium]
MSEENGMYISLLLEFYGSLLSERQREIVGYTVNDDLSLSEIAEITGITRQGVRDAICKATAQLEAYEEKLGMYRSFRERQTDGDRLIELIRSMGGDPEITQEAELLIRRICG